MEPSEGALLTEGALKFEGTFGGEGTFGEEIEVDDRRQLYDPPPG
jgi:hypothetical protein